MITTLPQHMIIRFPWLEDTPELNPSSFTFEDHEMDNSFLAHKMNYLPSGWVCLGWADAECIPVRPKPDMIAVRFADETGREFWCHML